jgi:hypothetical protein
MLVAQRGRRRTQTQMLFDSIDEAWRRSVADGSPHMSKLLAQALHEASVQVEAEERIIPRSNCRLSA